MWCLEITGHRLTLFWSSDLPGQARVAPLPNLHLTCSRFTALPHICSFDCLGDTSSVPEWVAFSFHQSFFTPLLPMCPHWSMLPLFPKGYITSLLIVRRKEFCSQKLDSSLLGVWHWWAPGSVRKSKSMLVWVNGEEHEHSGGAHMIKPTESGVNESLLAHCLWIFFFFSSSHLSPRLSLKINRNIAFLNEEFVNRGVLYILDLFLQLYPFLAKCFITLMYMLLYKFMYQPNISNKFCNISQICYLPQCRFYL